MSRYEITLARPARREVEALEAQLVARIRDRIQVPRGQPCPPGCRKVPGEEALCGSVSVNYRGLSEIKDATRIIDIVPVRHRRDACR